MFLLHYKDATFSKEDLLQDVSQDKVLVFVANGFLVRMSF